jgi:hypothetical protein
LFVFSEKINAISALPALTKGSKWDGKDGEVPAEEISLDDLFSDE